MKTGDLEENFRNTTYIVHAPTGSIRLRIGMRSPELDRLLDDLGETVWAFITAWNPMAAEPTPEENHRRNRELRSHLFERGCRFFPALGAGDDPGWEPEESFFIPGLAAAEGLELGRRFRQAAIVAGRRGGEPELLWC